MNLHSLAAALDDRLRQFAAIDLREDSSNPLFLKHFSGTRDRDPEGRFANGQVAKPDDFALAHGGPNVTIQMPDQRKGRLRTGMALGAAGTLAIQKRAALAGLLRRMRPA